MQIQTIASILFIAVLTLFLIIKRKKLVTQRILFPVLYFVMYRTNLGLRSMSLAAEKFRTPLKYLSFAGVIVGFLGMGVITFELVYNIYRMLTRPGAIAGVGIIQPFAPHIPGTIFVPFFYFVISIFIIAVIHEFSHGMIARAYNLKVKSSGFAFLGVILPILPAAFVEPDEKQIVKKPAMQQLSIYAAGPLSNILLAILIVGLFFAAIVPLSKAMLEINGVVVTDFLEGIESPAKLAGIKQGELITQIDSTLLTEPRALNNIISSRKPGDTVVVTTNESVYRVVLAASPLPKDSALTSILKLFGIVSKQPKKQEEKPMLGVLAKPNSIIRDGFKQRYGKLIPKAIIWIVGLAEWLFILSLGIGLFNLVPLGPIDGGRMLKTVLYKYFSQDRAQRIFVFVSTICLFALFSNIFLAIILR